MERMGKRTNRVSGITEHLCLQYQAPEKENEKHKVPLPYDIAYCPVLAFDHTNEVTSNAVSSGKP